MAPTAFHQIFSIHASYDNFRITAQVFALVQTRHHSATAAPSFRLSDVEQEAGDQMHPNIKYLFAFFFLTAAVMKTQVTHRYSLIPWP
jgi:hypothetical protein